MISIKQPAAKEGRSVQEKSCHVVPPEESCWNDSEAVQIADTLFQIFGIFKYGKARF